jgi:hypothetical protein
MPLWLMGLISAISFLTAFKCPKCQEINRPHSPETANIIQAIRKTPVLSGGDTVYVTLMHYAHRDFQPYYEDVVKCSGLRADTLWNNLNFYLSDSKVIMMPNGEYADAYYERVSQSIVLTFPTAGEPKLIRHEILHALMWHFNGYDATDSLRDNHPDSLYGNLHGKCRGLVRPH